jgi:hypothetical protein
VFASSDGQNGKFTAPLVRGGSIDFGLFGYSLGNTKIVNYK